MNLEEKQERLNQLWDSIDENAIDYLDANFYEIAPRLIEFLVVSILCEEEIDIGVFMNGSIISFDIYNTDKELLLKLNDKSQFELELSIMDYEDERRTYQYLLKESDLKIIPIGLKNIMANVAKSQESETLFIKSIYP
jgi:hypothetical protein